MAKRTGLGRGIGALIPTGTEAKERPADVFFAGSALPAAPTEEDAAPKASPASGARAKGAASAKKKAPERKTAAKPSGGSTTKTATKRAASTSTAKRTPATTSAEPATPEGAPLADVPGLHLVEVDPNAITANPRQPRKHFNPDDLAELVHSVREFGVLQPVVVRDTHDGGYELIMGERRTRAAREAGLARIPAIVRETADDDLLRDALLENIHRAELNPLEEASAYQQLIEDFGITQDQLADRIGRSRPQISNTIRLLRLPEAVQQRVAAGVLSAGHARTILSLDGDLDAMQKLSDKIVNEELSVRGAEAAAKQLATASAPAGTRSKPKPGARRAYLDEVSEKLGDRLNTKVKIDLTARKGQIKIGFATIQDLNRILGELGESGYEQ